MKKIESGPPFAKIMFVGEHPGPKELSEGRPFVDSSGWELEKMTGVAGLKLRESFLTNVLHVEPLGGKLYNMSYNKTQAKKLGIEAVDGRFFHNDIIQARQTLSNTIERVNPELIIALGDLALWALSGESGITKWRGSILDVNGRKMIPTFNPAAIQKNWPWRWISIQDFRRCFRESQFPEIRKPNRNYHITPSVNDALELLEGLRGKENICDIETQPSIGHIDCIGFASSQLDAFCIPIMCVKSREGYYSKADEFSIMSKMKDVMTDSTTSFTFHNGLYDLWYFVHDYGFLPKVSDDTMVMQHMAFPAMQKALYFCASMYCNYYRFWKDDGRKWNPKTDSEDQHWIYCCDDCTYTWEVKEALKATLERYRLTEQYRFQMRLFHAVFRMMLRGVKVDLGYKNRLKGDLLEALQSRSEWFESVLGHPLNPKSNAKTGQMRRLFYEDLKVKPVIDRKTRQPTLNDDALETIKLREPLLKPLVNNIQESRSIGVFKSNFADAELSKDDRMRSSVNLTNVKTYRFSMSKNSFGTGCNMQTMPKGTEKD